MTADHELRALERENTKLREAVGEHARKWRAIVEHSAPRERVSDLLSAADAYERAARSEIAFLATLSDEVAATRRVNTVVES